MEDLRWTYDSMAEAFGKPMLDHETGKEIKK
jgi:hypothetical protein